MSKILMILLAIFAMSETSAFSATCDRLGTYAANDQPELKCSQYTASQGYKAFATQINRTCWETGTPYACVVCFGCMDQNDYVPYDQ